MTAVNEDNDDGECEQRVKAIVALIESAFSFSIYPGDSNLGESHQEQDNIEIIDCFKGKHWRDVSPENVRAQSFNLYFFTPDAFRFFLPAFMRATLLHSEETDIAWGFTFGCLVPPEEYVAEAMRTFMTRVEGFTPAQRNAVKAYVDLYVQIETSYPDPRRECAAAFWAKFCTSSAPN